jgi:hypothetical protein
MSLIFLIAMVGIGLFVVLPIFILSIIDPND